MVKPLMLLIVATLCCCLITADAFLGCHCLRTVKKPVPFRVIKKIEMVGASGSCRRTETILTKKNGSKMCIDPNQDWFKALQRWLQSKNSTPTDAPTDASTNF